MKREMLLFCLCMILSLSGSAQLKYVSADKFPLYGKISDQTETRYERLPVALKQLVRPPVWELGKNTAGLYIRFSSNTTKIGLKWILLENRVMNHMTATGIKGFDLYCLQDDRWEFVNSARPNTSGKEQEAVIVSNMIQKTREYLLFMPLYDGVISFEIGIDPTAVVEQPEVPLPRSDKPVVCYGTSILQGGCASRPGMAHTNILVRRLNCEFINLGFSGNGQLDYEIAEIIAGYNASLIILDFMPNVDATQVREKMEKFYTIIRGKSPDIPIVFVENPLFPQAVFDTNMFTVIKEKNRALHEEFHKLISQGEKNIRLISSADMIGCDNEATVDGIHFTDLGFQRYAAYLYPYIEEYLNR